MRRATCWRSTTTTKTSGPRLNTHQADSYFMARLPADGTYYVHIGDTARQGGEEYGYRLRLSAPQPDFELRVGAFQSRPPRQIERHPHGLCPAERRFRRANQALLEGPAGRILGCPGHPVGHADCGAVDSQVRPGCHQRAGHAIGPWRCEDRRAGACPRSCARGRPDAGLLVAALGPG